MHRRISYEKSIHILQSIMLNHFHGWLRLPITNLIERNDIIRFCCSRSWQASHIMRALFALNQIEHHDEYPQEIKSLPRQPYSAYDDLYKLACSVDFSNAALIGIELIKKILHLADIYFPEVRSQSFLKTIDCSVAIIDPLKMGLKYEKREQLALSTAKAYSSIQGIQGILIDGSIAKGISDKNSDIDITTYCTMIPDLDIRKKRTRMIDENSIIIAESDRFTLDGIYVHIDFELIDEVERAFSSPTWQSLGIWESIQCGKIVYDSNMLLQRWKDALSNMNLESRKNLVIELFSRLHEDYQRLSIAIEIDDPVYFSIILGNILTHYFQILCLVNHRFIVFPKWMHIIIHELSYKPVDVYEKFSDILSIELEHKNLFKIIEGLRELISDLLDLTENLFNIPKNLSSL